MLKSYQIHYKFVDLISTKHYFHYFTLYNIMDDDKMKILILENQKIARLSAHYSVRLRVHFKMKMPFHLLYSP